MGGIGVAVDQPVAHRRPALIADKLQLQALVGRKTQFMRQYGNGRIHQRQIADPHGGCRHCPSPSSSSATISAAATSPRSEEHTSELQSLMRISYAVFCLKKKNTEKKKQTHKHGITTTKQRE